MTKRIDFAVTAKTITALVVEESVSAGAFRDIANGRGEPLHHITVPLREFRNRRCISATHNIDNNENDGKSQQYRHMNHRFTHLLQ
jgi:hypothetical protein